MPRASAELLFPMSFSYETILAAIVFAGANLYLGYQLLRLFWPLRMLRYSKRSPATPDMMRKLAQLAATDKEVRVAVPIGRTLAVLVGAKLTEEEMRYRRFWWRSWFYTIASLLFFYTQPHCSDGIPLRLRAGASRAVRRRLQALPHQSLPRRARRTRRRSDNGRKRRTSGSAPGRTGKCRRPRSQIGEAAAAELSSCKEASQQVCCINRTAIHYSRRLSEDLRLCFLARSCRAKKRFLTHFSAFQSRTVVFTTHIIFIEFNRLLKYRVSNHSKQHFSLNRTGRSLVFALRTCQYSR